MRFTIRGENEIWTSAGSISRPCDATIRVESSYVVMEIGDYGKEAKFIADASAARVIAAALIEAASEIDRRTK